MKSAFSALLYLKGLCKAHSFQSPHLESIHMLDRRSLPSGVLGSVVNESTFSAVIDVKLCLALLTDHPSRHSRDVSGPAKRAFEGIRL